MVLRYWPLLWRITMSCASVKLIAEFESLGVDPKIPVWLRRTLNLLLLNFRKRPKVNRDRVASALWPDKGLDAARINMRQVCFQLNRRSEARGLSVRLVVRRFRRKPEFVVLQLGTSADSRQGATTLVQQGLIRRVEELEREVANPTRQIATLSRR